MIDREQATGVVSAFLEALFGAECDADVLEPRVTDEMVERGRRAINRQVTKPELQHAKEGKPFAEEKIARVVLVAALSSPETKPKVTEG